MIKNGKEYYMEKIWRRSKKVKTYDSKGIVLPYPEENNKSSWYDKDIFLKKITLLQKLLDTKNKYEKYDESMPCLLCKEDNVLTKRYIFQDYLWDDDLLHYITKHNITPSVPFRKMIYDKTKKIKYDKTTKRANNKIKLKRTVRDNKEYVMIEKNQMLILDALMIHGGYVKRYPDENIKTVRYSEHAGALDFQENILTKIIVSGMTKRVDVEDNEIYMPLGMDDISEYEYIFHTHPPTPHPGGRAKGGVLYELPSIGDIFNFIENYNTGNVIGSLIVTAEGLYNIRKYVEDKDDGGLIKVDDDKLYETYENIFANVQRDAIRKYGVSFTTGKFYSVIAQDTSYIERFNDKMKKFQIFVDYYPRVEGENGEWYIDTVFLVFRNNRKK